VNKGSDISTIWISNKTKYNCLQFNENKHSFRIWLCVDTYTTG